VPGAEDGLSTPPPRRYVATRNAAPSGLVRLPTGTAPRSPVLPKYANRHPLGLFAPGVTGQSGTSSWRRSRGGTRDSPPFPARR